MDMGDFVLDIDSIRKSAKTHMEKGAVTPNYKADREAVLQILDAALATEWLCVLRYTQHSKAAQGLQAESVAKHFAEHAQQEQVHAEVLASRIKQLGKSPNLNPDSFSKLGHTEYKECDTLTAMIRENLFAERIAIDAYSASIRFIGDKDPTTRRILETILAVEENHADEMSDLLVAFAPRDSLS